VIAAMTIAHARACRQYPAPTLDLPMTFPPRTSMPQ
jgi:hypothetical protein